MDASAKHTLGLQPVRISSRKIGSRNGRARHDFDGRLSDKFSIVFSSGALILNLTDGERMCSVIMDEASTDALAARFAERAALSKASGETR